MTRALALLAGWWTVRLALYITQSVLMHDVAPEGAGRNAS